MIQTVVPRLSAVLPGVSFLTVHDSLAIDVQHADQKGISPHYKISPFLGIISLDK